jgi:DNA-binding transcriptional MocR family regulator
MKQPVGHSPAKFVLVAIAERAGKENTAWPSVSALVEATCQNRKTVLANMQRLVEMGYLIDTGERTGQTKSVVVYRLNEPESSPKINTAKQSQNLPVAVPKDTPLSDTCFGTACEDEAVPKTTRSSPKILYRTIRTTIRNHHRTTKGGRGDSRMAACRTLGNVEQI